MAGALLSKAAAEVSLAFKATGLLTALLGMPLWELL